MKNDIYRWVLAIVAGGFAAAANNAADAALIASFTDRATWEAAAGTPDFFEDFSGPGSFLPVSPPFVIGSLTIEGVSKPTTLTPSLVRSSLPAESVDGTKHLLLRMGAIQFNDASLILTFERPITAIGFDLNPNPNTIHNPAGNNPNVIDFTTSAGGGSFNLPTTDVTEFRGFTFDMPFTSFTVSSNSFQPVWGLDNLAAVSSPVPEPSSVAVWSLLALVVGGCGWHRRKRQAA